MASKEQNTIIDPTEQELKVYQDLVNELDEMQMDNLANAYYEYINTNKDEKKCSFAKFVIDKLIRPVQEGDTINYVDDKGQLEHLFCLVRKTIEDKDYLIFAMVDKETEELRTEQVFLFYVEGKDELGMEIIDVFEKGEEAERILDLIEASEDVEVTGTEVNKDVELAKETIRKEWEK